VVAYRWNVFGGRRRKIQREKGIRETERGDREQRSNLGDDERKKRRPIATRLKRRKMRWTMVDDDRDRERRMSN
jgi:hypothetical protein